MTEDQSGNWAKTTSVGIEAVRSLGVFLSPPAEVARDIVTNYLHVIKFECTVRLAERVKGFLAQRGLAAPTRKVPLSVALPLLDAASMEQDDELQELWARMLVNFGDADSGVEIRRAYTEMLTNMSALDVRVLAKIAEVSDPSKRRGVRTAQLPEHAALAEEGEGDQPLPRDEVVLSLSNLMRLGCLTPAGWAGGEKPNYVWLTPIGGALVDACTKPKTSTEADGSRQGTVSK